MDRAREETLRGEPHFSVTEAVFFAAPVAIGLYTAEGACVLANDAYASLVGATKDYLLQQNFHDISAWDHGGLHTAALNTLATGEPTRMEFSVVTSFGREVWARCNFARVSRDGVPHLLFIANDLTELKDRERELIAALREARASNEAKSRFLASVSHELRTPLNAILGFSEMLRMPDLAGRHPSRLEEYATDIHGSAKYLLSLIDDILDLTRLEHGLYQTDSMTFDPVPLVDSAIKLCKHSADARQLTISRNDDAGPWAVVGDARLFQQSLVNLLSNAVKFSKPGGLITVELAADDKMIRIAVRDSGIGIPAADLPQLGQPFRQVPRAGIHATPGMGLGLAITKAVTERQGGRLVLESTEGVGTTAALLLPAGDAAVL